MADLIPCGWDKFGVAYTYSSPSAAHSIAVDGDTVLPGCSNNVGCLVWFGCLYWTKDRINLEGLFAGQEVCFHSASSRASSFSMAGAGCTIKNVSFIYGGVITYQGGTFDSCLIDGIGLDIGWLNNTEVMNCKFVGTHTGIYRRSDHTGNLTVNNCTFSACYIGLSNDAGAGLESNNNVFWGCFSEFTGPVGSGSNNATRTVTASTPPTGRIDIGAIDAKFMRDNLDGTLPQDYRITKDSPLCNAGVDVGLTEDIDGNAYDDGVFPVGCSKGLNYVDKLLTSAVGGNYHDPENSEVKLNARVGVAPRVGTYDPTGSPPEVATIVFTDRKDGTGTDAAVSDIDPLAQSNSLYYRKFRTTTWILASTFTVAGTIAIDVAIGFYEYKLSATNTAGTFCDVGSFTVTTSGVEEAQYRVSGVVSMPGSPYKRALLEKVERPINP